MAKAQSKPRDRKLFDEEEEAPRSNKADRAGTMRVGMDSPNEHRNAKRAAGWGPPDPDACVNPSSGKRAEPPGNDLELGQLEHNLRIDKHRLDDALMEQPQHFHDAARYYAEAVSRRDYAKDALKRFEANLEIEIRAGGTDDGDDKVRITDKVVAARVTANTKRADYVARLIEAEREVNRWDALMEAYKQRSHAIRDLVYLHGASYWAQNSAQGASREQLEAQAEEGRAALAAGRQPLRHSRDRR